MEKIERTFIEEEMEQSYINYAMSVIRGRAIPDVRDGLKTGATPYPLRSPRTRPHSRKAAQEGRPYRRGGDGEVPSSRE